MFGFVGVGIGGSLWLAVGFHAGHNLTAGLLGTGGYGWSLLVSFGVFCGFGVLMLWTRVKRVDPTVVQMPTQTETIRLRPVKLGRTSCFGGDIC